MPDSGAAGNGCCPNETRKLKASKTNLIGYSSG